MSTSLSRARSVAASGTSHHGTHTNGNGNGNNGMRPTSRGQSLHQSCSITGCDDRRMPPTAFCSKHAKQYSPGAFDGSSDGGRRGNAASPRQAGGSPLLLVPRGNAPMRAPLQVNIAASPAHRSGLRHETPSPSTTRSLSPAAPGSPSPSAASVAARQQERERALSALFRGGVTPTGNGSHGSANGNAISTPSPMARFAPLRLRTDSAASGAGSITPSGYRGRTDSSASNIPIGINSPSYSINGHHTYGNGGHTSAIDIRDREDSQTPDRIPSNASTPQSIGGHTNDDASPLQQRRRASIVSPKSREMSNLLLAIASKGGSSSLTIPSSSSSSSYSNYQQSSSTIVPSISLSTINPPAAVTAPKASGASKNNTTNTPSVLSLVGKGPSPPRTARDLDTTTATSTTSTPRTTRRSNRKRNPSSHFTFDSKTGTQIPVPSPSPSPPPSSTTATAATNTGATAASSAMSTPMMTAASLSAALPWMQTSWQAMAQAVTDDASLTAAAAAANGMIPRLLPLQPEHALLLAQWRDQMQLMNNPAMLASMTASQSPTVAAIMAVHQQRAAMIAAAATAAQHNATILPAGGFTANQHAETKVDESSDGPIPMLSSTLSPAPLPSTSSTNVKAEDSNKEEKRSSPPATASSTSATSSSLLSVPYSTTAMTAVLGPDDATMEKEMGPPSPNVPMNTSADGHPAAAATAAIAAAHATMNAKGLWPVVNNNSSNTNTGGNTTEYLTINKMHSPLPPQVKSPLRTSMTNGPLSPSPPSSSSLSSIPVSAFGNPSQYRSTTSTGATLATAVAVPAITSPTVTQVAAATTPMFPQLRGAISNYPSTASSSSSSSSSDLEITPSSPLTFPPLSPGMSMGMMLPSPPTGMSPPTTGRRRAKNALELPPGWKMVERSSPKCKYKTYVSPQGKSFRSLAGVHRFLDKHGDWQQQAAAAVAAAAAAAAATATLTHHQQQQQQQHAAAQAAAAAAAAAMQPPPSSSMDTTTISGEAMHMGTGVPPSSKIEDGQRMLRDLRDSFIREHATTLLASASSSSSSTAPAPSSDDIMAVIAADEKSAPPIGLRTVLLTHVACLRHDTCDGNLDTPARLRGVLSALCSTRSLLRSLEWRSAHSSVAMEDLLACHDRDYVSSIFHICDMVEKGIFPYISIDPPNNHTIISSATREALLYGAGAVTCAVDEVCYDHAHNAFVAVRPAGHHAEIRRAMGHCIFNNVCIGVAHARRVHKLKKIAIVDFDVSHGNGTQQIVERDPSILYISMHRPDIFPFSPNNPSPSPSMYKNVINVALTSRDQFLQAADRLREALDVFGAELIFISAGFNGHHNDLQHQSLSLATDDYDTITRAIVSSANRTCPGRVISVLEGGYHPDELGRCVAAHVNVLFKQPLT